MEMYRFDLDETRAQFRAHFGGEPLVYRPPNAGPGEWLAYRAYGPALWVWPGHAPADRPHHEVTVLGLADETDLQEWLAAIRRLNGPVDLAALAATLRPHLPGAKGN